MLNVNDKPNGELAIAPSFNSGGVMCGKIKSDARNNDGLKDLRIVASQRMNIGMKQG